MSANGNLLTVSTISEVKVFRLRQRKAENTDALRVSKVDVPQKLVNSGAKLVTFSPDAHWLVVVDIQNHIRLFRIFNTPTPKEGIRLLPKPIELKSLHRESVKQTLQHGSLGNYARTITRLAFSEDSRILVAGDLSGYLDSWVLEGHEDLTQDLDNIADDAKSSASSDDGSEDDEAKPLVVLGQHWIRNPAATLLPKLPSAPLILSFRPSPPSSKPPIINGNTSVHPTRHNPHPHWHDLPSGEDRLLALTSEHHLYEFHILKGSLSDWSRRNPTQTLPTEFRDVRDRAMGCIWHISEDRQRIWLYGSAWLWMFDLAKDFQSAKDTDNARPKLDNRTANQVALKRKLDNDADADEDTSPRKRGTGAGGRVRDSELGTGIGRKMRRTVGPNASDSRWTSLDALISPNTDDDDDDDSPGDWSALTTLRRGPGGDMTSVAANGDAIADAVNGTVVDSHGTAVVRKAEADARPGWYSTYKYRPILGIVPIGTTAITEDAGRDASEGMSDFAGIEVALVERPMWDVDLPPRYVGDQEWDN